ncbi:hypothetical protein ENKNEFLB_03280 [Nocardioides aquaticus]|uniref:Endonuclease/exonuclease/phosphatase domain-containing protein n=1 Tax=Nocardioides aquaticus TaxID=160826 RepID=A0ABX8EK31_9ACTN|nr:endonuclease/exonuclease/phosphatase family protein [Nocardioides aquaticus]QVT80879.1 hypothetical protein ENKNEFLB_03280 [Nocardioides aquaticus]
MNHPPRPRTRAPRSRRTRLVAALLTLPAVTASLLVAPVPAVADPTGTDPTVVELERAASLKGSDLTIVQANLRSPQPFAGFQADARKVQGFAPDFITYNEVAFRNDALLAPAGYKMWRTAGQYTGASPVAWRSDRWEMTARGTRQVSSYGKKPPGRTTLLGMRFASWVTLRSTIDDRVLSVISMHAAPKVRGMPDLRRTAVRNLGTLVRELAPRGPVLVGGDFNVGARSTSYPADLLGAAQLRSTFERLQSWFGTGDHGGNTIDYLFVRDAGQLEADVHFPVELNSDHDAVVAGLSWTTKAPGATVEVRNDPGGEVAQQRAVVVENLREIRSAPVGGLVQVATQGLTLRAVYRDLLAAVERGVKVRYVTRGSRLSEHEALLAARLRASAGSSFRQCTASCAAQWRTHQMPSVVLVSRVDGTPRSTVSSTRRMRAGMVQRAARAVSTTRSSSLAAAVAAFQYR